MLFKRTANLLIALIAAGSAALNAGCQTACTAIGCAQALTITVAGAATVAASDTWRVEITADSVSSVCTVAAPLECTRLPQCDHPEVAQLYLDACAGATPPTRLDHIWVTPAAAQVSVRVLRNNMQVATQSYTPTYATSMPNGPGCGPTCRSASATLTLPPP